MSDAEPPPAQGRPPATRTPGKPTPAPSGARAWLCLVFLVVGVLGLLPRAVGTWPGSNATQAADAQIEASPRLACLSYAPFRRDGHTPLDPHLSLSDEQLSQDLRLMAQWTGCIRTYGTDHGQDRIPALAAAVGLKVVQGAWISRDPVGSQQEIDRAIALARAHPETVRLLVLGNEVLLRQERSPRDLASILRDARQRSTVPVAYADVWEFWLRHAEVLAPEVDVVAAHVLPYWEDVPIGIAGAVGHVLSIHRHLVQSFDGKPVWIAETGWPSAGRQRGPAVPGVREQAQFVRELRAQLPGQGIDYNLIEAFDQPWKRQFEGAMGGAWGLADAQGVLRDPGADALPADPMAVGALWGAFIGLMTALLMVAVLTAMWRKRSVHLPRAGSGAHGVDTALLMQACLGATMGLLLGAHLNTVAIWWRSPVEWAIGLVHAGLSLAVCLCCLGYFCRMRSSCSQCSVMRIESPNLRLLAMLVRAWLLITAWQAITLVFDGRYRPLPALLVAAPALGMWCLPTVTLHRLGPADRFLALVLSAAAPVLIVMEGAANTQALALAAAWLMASAAVWVSGRGNFVAIDRGAP